MDAYQRAVLGDMLFLARQPLPDLDAATSEGNLRHKAERDQLFAGQDEFRIFAELLLLARAAFPGLSRERIAQVVQCKIEGYRPLRGVDDPAPAAAIVQSMPPVLPAEEVATLRRVFERRSPPRRLTEDLEQDLAGARLTWWAWLGRDCPAAPA